MSGPRGATRPRVVVLDNEAVQALADPAHAKHRRVVALVEVAVRRNRERSGSVRLLVPTAVRVEAGWDRGAAAATVLNRLAGRDHVLDGPSADVAARLGQTLQVSVADAHIGAVLALEPGPHAVVTSDSADLGRIIAHLDAVAHVVRV
jgi:hypothetical protein